MMSDKKVETQCVEALRQYRHNDSSGLVAGYDKEIIDREMLKTQEEIARQAAEIERLKLERDERDTEQQIKALEGLLSSGMAWDEMNASGRRKVRQRIEQLRKGGE